MPRLFLCVWFVSAAACLQSSTARFSPLQLAVTQLVTVRGFITDASNGQSLPGANVILLNAAGEIRGGVSDSDGFYQISAIPAGEYELRISFIGFRMHVDTLMLGEERFVTLSVALAPGDASLDEVVVEDDRGAAVREAGLQTVRPSDIERIPTPDIGGDLASYLQTLPGIVSVGDRGGRLYVRGGTPSQNLVLLDGSLIFQPFHIVGFFSAFPQELITSVDVYAGGFGARYSGRVSSVIDVTTRHGNTESHEASFSASPFLTGVRVEGPIYRGTSSFLASYRTSVIDETARFLTGTEVPVGFSDLFIKLHRTDTQNDRCSMSLVRTSDSGQITPGDDFRWSNFVLGGQCLAFPSGSPFLFEGNAGISHVGNEVGNASNPDRTSSTLQVQTDVNFTYRYQRSEVRWGLFMRSSWTSFELGGQFQDLDRDSELLIASGAYGDVHLRKGRFEINPGLSLTIHPFLFSPAIEPRFRFSWEPNLLRGGKWSGAVGLYEQTLVGISDERDAGSLFVAWMPAPIGTRQTKAVHTLLGWHQPLLEGVAVSVEGYYKRLGSIHVPIWSTIARFTTTLELANGHSYGYDARLEIDRGPFYGFAGYGYGVTEYEARQDNFGVWYGEPVQRYHPPHDMRHQLTLLTSFRLAKSTQISVQWQFGSGLPFTRAIGFDELIRLYPLLDYKHFLGTTRILFEKPYRARLPSYHRLDASLEYSVDTSFGSFTAQAGAVNAYDRSNIFYLDIFTLRRVDQLPLVPYVGVKIDLR